MSNGGGPSIPDSVLSDLTEATLRRYLSDAEFRQALLSDPATCNQDNMLGLSDDTVAWINDRVQERGLQTLLGGLPPYDMAPM
jgi:hypothetical protein